MTINLIEIYKGLKAYRQERGLTAQNQKSGYIINIMEEMGELAQALRDYERINKTSKNDYVGYYALVLEKAEFDIVDALCDIAVLTINAGAGIPCKYKPIQIDKLGIYKDFNLLLAAITEYSFNFNVNAFVAILRVCAILCEKYGFNFEIAMLETIKEISSRTGTYDEVAKKWVKDESDEAKAKWYKADYEKARI